MLFLHFWCTFWKCSFDPVIKHNTVILTINIFFINSIFFIPKLLHLSLWPFVLLKDIPRLCFFYVCFFLFFFVWGNLYPFLTWHDSLILQPHLFLMVHWDNYMLHQSFFVVARTNIYCVFSQVNQIGMFGYVSVKLVFTH